MSGGPMDCANCGAAVPSEGGYCPGCGTALGTRLCANGHVMDAGWAECRYCSGQPAPGDSGNGAGDPVAAEAPSETIGGFGSRASLLGKGSGLSRGAAHSEGAPQSPPAAAGGGARHRTVYDPGLTPEAPGPAADRARQGSRAPRLVGWLVTFSLDPSGVDFRLREGANEIGADPDCDVVIKGVGEISGKHAVLRYRQGRFHIRDNDSTNGTYINDRDIFGEAAVEIDEGDRIRLGPLELTLHRL